MFTAALHFRTLFLCPRFLQLHGFYWQGWRKHTKTFLSGGLPWLTDPTTHSAGNSFLALLCGLKTMEKKTTESAAVRLVIVSTWILKTAIPTFTYWSEICNRDTLQITWKDTTLCNNLHEQPVRFKQGCVCTDATNTQHLLSQSLLWFLPVFEWNMDAKEGKNG